LFDRPKPTAGCSTSGRRRRKEEVEEEEEEEEEECILRWRDWLSRNSGTELPLYATKNLRRPKTLFYEFCW
jgi:hypothetical protein